MEAFFSKILRNAMFNSVGRFWITGVNLLLTPYIVHHLGVDTYGIWTLVFVLVGYFGLLDLGVGLSLVKYLAEAYADDDIETMSQTVSTGFFMYAAVSVMMITAVWWGDRRIVTAFHIPASMVEDSVFLLRVCVMIFCLNGLFGAFSGVIAGLQRMDILNLVAVIASIPQVIGTVLVLELGYGLRGLIVNSGIVLFVTILLNLLFAWKLVPRLRFGLGFVRKTVFRRLLGYGIKSQVCSFAALINLQTDRLLVGYFLNTRAVTYYELGFRVARMTRSIPELIMSAVIPAVSELDRKEGKATLQPLYLKGTKYVALVAVPLFALVFVTAPTIMAGWMGQEYPQSTVVLRFLTVGYLATVMTGFGTSIARGLAVLDYEVRFAILTMTLNIALGIAMTLTLGFFGPVIASTTAAVISSAYFLIAFGRYLNVSFTQVIRETLPYPLVVCFIAVCLVIIGDHLLTTVWQTTGRMPALGRLVVSALVLCFVYCTGMWRGAYLDVDDRVILSRSIGRSGFLPRRGTPVEMPK